MAVGSQYDTVHVYLAPQDFDGFVSKFLERWCGREDLNLHTLTGTCTSSMRVCQFRHDRKINFIAPTSSNTYLKLVRLP